MTLISSTFCAKTVQVSVLVTPLEYMIVLMTTYRGADNSLARPTSRFILLDGENISFDAILVIYIYIYITNIPPIMIINRIYEHQNLLSL